MLEIKQLAKEYDAICILGPTASGKTRFAVEMAIKLSEIKQGKFELGAEILSADSRQVYRGMDIGTGKDLNEYCVSAKMLEKHLPNQMKEWLGCSNETIGIPCHLTDIADAGFKYNIFEYQRDFSQAYRGVIERNRIPIICGGSGLYIEAATRGYELHEVQPNIALRESLEQKSMEQLIQMLFALKEKHETKPHNETDFDTKKRVIRAIEIEMALDAERSKGKSNRDLILPQNVAYLGIMVDRDTRNERIDKRLHARLQEGLIDEVKGLLEKGIAPDDLIYYGLEYKFVTLYLTGELPYDTMVERLAVAIHQFAKRQMTWFRGMERKGIKINWITI